MELGSCHRTQPQTWIRRCFWAVIFTCHVTVMYRYHRLLSVINRMPVLIRRRSCGVWWMSLGSCSSVICVVRAYAYPCVSPSRAGIVSNTAPIYIIGLHCLSLEQRDTLPPIRVACLKHAPIPTSKWETFTCPACRNSTVISTSKSWKFLNSYHCSNISCQ